MTTRKLTLLRGGGTEDQEALFRPWQAGDIAGLTTVLDKDAPIEAPAERELNEALLGKRDPGMADWCKTFLTQEGTHTATFAVGPPTRWGKPAWWSCCARRTIPLPPCLKHPRGNLF